MAWSLPFTRKQLFVWTISVLLLVNEYMTIAKANPVQLNSKNFHETVGSTKVVFVNFYADWCKFSRLLAPVFEDAAKQLAQQYANEPNTVVLGRIDCDQENDLCSQLSVSKYPTLKLWRFGQMAKREYRGQRSMEAFVKFIQDQVTNPITPLLTQEDVAKISMEKQSAVVGYLMTKNEHRMQQLMRIALTLRDECQFFVAVGDAAQLLSNSPHDVIMFREKTGKEHREINYPGDANDLTTLSRWIGDRCVPLVREITFENAEEYTEEGLPFLILFYNADDTSIIDEYKKVIESEVLDERSKINFLTANGETFSHPLAHLGKSKADLPLIAIDSFRHMFVFPNIKEMDQPGKLKQFIQDLHSGKLHRVFHYGYDPKGDEQAAAAAEKPQIEHQQQPLQPVQPGQHLPAQPDHHQHNEGAAAVPKNQQQHQPTSPPESTFAKLAPSANRYTLLRRHDEL